MDWNAIITNQAYQIALALSVIVVYATNLLTGLAKSYLPKQIITIVALVIGGVLGYTADLFINLTVPGWMIGMFAVVAYNVYWDIDPTGSLIEGIKAKIGIKAKPDVISGDRIGLDTDHAER